MDWRAGGVKLRRVLVRPQVAIRHPSSAFSRALMARVNAPPSGRVVLRPLAQLRELHVKIVSCRSQDRRRFQRASFNFPGFTLHEGCILRKRFARAIDSFTLTIQSLAHICRLAGIKVFFILNLLLSARAT